MDTAIRLQTARLRIGTKFSAGSRRFYSAPTTSITTLVPTQVPMGTGVNSRGQKRPGRKAHCTPPIGAKVKKKTRGVVGLLPHMQTWNAASIITGHQLSLQFQTHLQWQATRVTEVKPPNIRVMY